MIETLFRKARQVFRDPVLRRWLIGRLLGRWPSEPAFKVGHPPYLTGLLPLGNEPPLSSLPDLATGVPESAINLPLPGLILTLQPGEEDDLFNRTFSDTETLLALHRFAWMPLIGQSVDPAWVCAIWRVWCRLFASPDQSWAWHPYTASERAINILGFCQRHGIPCHREKTLNVLAAHGPAIADRLEYYGDHHTSNHLANNGRGLLLLGLGLKMPECADVGGRILTQESKRIFLKSGVLREGSSHYHALLTRNYYVAWQAAKDHKRPEAQPLKDVVEKSLSVLKLLSLPGGPPLIGDISPDCPPSVLFSEIQDRVIAAPDCDSEALEKDGWLRVDTDNWVGLWYAAPAGLSHMPGHGHQDCGSFELHCSGLPVFIDPGRGSYGEDGVSAQFRSARVHNTLTLNDQDPFPPNKPYFEDSFRRTISGPPPELARTDTGVRLVHHGYCRLESTGAVTRLWSFDKHRLTLVDRVDGSGDRTITRTLCTALDVVQESDGLILRGKTMSFLLRENTDCGVSLEKGVRWIAYGESKPATFIRFTTRQGLPWQGSLSLEII